MINNPLDDIIKHNIDISSPASKEVTFDKILLVVPGPASTGTKTMSKTTPISKADDLLDYGFTADEDAYIAATVAFSQNPSPDELYICIRQETDSDTYEGIATTLARAAKEVEFYGIHLTSFKDDSDVSAAMAWAEANEKLFGYEYSSYEDTPSSNKSYYRTYCIFSGLADGYDADSQPKENEYAALALMAKCFGYDPGTETWDLKELSVIAPSALDSEQKKSLEEKSINTFLRYAGNNVTIGGYVLAGEWIDVIRFRDWLKAEMQSRIFNVLKTNRKVPFTDSGIGLIEGAMESTLKKGQDIGGISPTEYDEDGNEIPGFSVSVPKKSDLTEAQRKSRKITGCYYTAKLAGAIHVVEIEGFLTF